MNEILERYVGSEIGINLIKPLHIESVTLDTVQDSYFTVTREKDGNKYHFPFSNVVKIIENSEGVTVGGFFSQKKTHPLVVKTGHIVDYLPM